MDTKSYKTCPHAQKKAGTSSSYIVGDCVREDGTRCYVSGDSQALGGSSHDL